jgi:uncharacterized protein (DUF433 family)
VVHESEQQCATVPDLDWLKCPVVESVPGKVSGAWVLKGTRMPVSAIFENIEAGASIDDILEWFEGKRQTIHTYSLAGVCTQCRAQVNLALRCNRWYSNLQASAGRLFVRFPPPSDAVILKRSSV